jgi:hypothetical protein
MVVFDATRWGGAHCHLSRNSVNLYSGSRMLICDPGVFSYEMTDPFAPYGKSTPAHNTVHLAGLSQAEADPHTRHVHLFHDAAVVNSSYESGYWPGRYTWGWYEGKCPGLFARHGRTLLWLRGRGAVVWDSVAVDLPGQQYAAHWQLPAGAYALDADRRRVWTAGEEDNVLVQVLQARDPVRMTVREGHRLPERGWLPGTGPGDCRPAPQIAVEGIAQERTATLTTLLCPFRGGRAPAVEAQEFTDRTGRAQGILLRWPDGDSDAVAATPNLLYQVGEAGALVSDGSLVAVSLRSGRPWRVLVVDGMFVEWNGELLVDRQEAGTFREELGK